MSGFSVGGRAHRMLRLLVAGDAGFNAIVQAVHQGILTENRRRKLWRLIDVLQARAMIGKDERTFFILPAGEAELERLEKLEAAPSVRVFARQEAA